MTCTIKPIGSLVVNSNNIKVELNQQYLPALKNTALFSHLIIVIDNPLNNLKNQGSQFYLSELYFFAAKLQSQSEHEISLSAPLEFSGKYNVYDIKPYFPCEDRVANASIIKNNLYNINLVKSKVDKQLIQQSKELKEKGVIIKNQDGYFLDLTQYSEEFIKQLSEFSHLRVIWHFSRFTKERYKRVMQVKPPYEKAPRSGIFATRSPVRPNPIAITTAKIKEVDIVNKLMAVSDLDAFNNTPFLDVLPYLPEKDFVDNLFVPEYLSHWPASFQEEKKEFSIGLSTLPLAINTQLEKYSIVLENTINSEPFKKKIVDTEIDSQNIIVKGAKQNNLKDVTVSIPKNKLTVITGVSGSGKSSLAFDTLFAESQRRFLGNLSGANKDILGNLPKPEVEQIIGLPPAIAIKQSSSNKNTRSTVGTVTDVNNYLRILFAKIGLRRCPICGRTIECKSENEIIKLLLSLKPNTELKLKHFNSNEVILIANMPLNITSSFKHTLKKSVHSGLEQGKGALILVLDNDTELTLQTKEMCYHCNQIMFELTASDFSFNNPESMCSKCNGLGSIMQVDSNLIINKPHLSLFDGASEWWGNLRRHAKNPNANWMRGEVLALADEMQLDLNIPWQELPKEFKQQVIFGSQGKEVTLVYKNKNGRAGKITRPVEGAFHAINRLFKKGTGSSEFIINNFMAKQRCPKCNGERLNTASRLVSINGVRYPEIINMNISNLSRWLNECYMKLSKQHKAIAEPIIKEVNNRVKSLIDVGVSYLSLNRSVPSLSGGELQRIRLATQVNNGLSNMLYVLDEPSAGLHAYDNKKLINTLKQLNKSDNTVVVVEHNRDTIVAADNIIDIGPGAGIHGGKVIAKGNLQQIKCNKDSITGKYLNNKLVPKVASEPKQGYLSLTGANEHNLKNIDIKIPLGVVTCITGVSGSGKSTLLLKTLYPALQYKLNRQGAYIENYKTLQGHENVDSVLRISQTPIGRSPRSNPATYTGVFDYIRDVFAKIAKSQGFNYTKGHFSFNSKQGQCEECKGEGRKNIKLHFMPDIWVECVMCKGKRYKTEVLEVKYHNKTIADILDMDISEAYKLFKNEEKVAKILKVLCDVGLGYLKLGQSSLTLSGGEAQRVKLAKELSKKETGKTLYILDEPTAGLHFKDIEQLTKLFNTIVKQGNTLVIIEHNLEVISKADYIIDLGPYGGDQGGYVLASGTVNDIILCKNSITGQMLSKY